MPRILYLCGGWPGHNPGGVAGWLVPKLRDMGYETELTADPTRLGDDLSGFDLVVLGWTQCDTTERLDPAVEKRFSRSVRDGLGVAGWHGMAASFRASLLYNMIVGGNCVSHPGGEGVRVPYKVRVTDPRHPVADGIADFTVASEQYYMHVDPANRVIAETTFSGEHIPWIEGLTSPVAWTRTWGRGKVFYMSVGHYLEDLQLPDAERMLAQGVAWATRN
ncbi:ThuA domain-containing protein [Thermobifida halotolerans]|uniref:ThuA domain-containing protein n=1 Tax=Thermobifida halotolerans TaxID=483545 RepID=A0A399G689_9ACTN|nr:ThuA domain-containing protein [Thermobifida halotolerans]UOE19979.1 ThuA domain-containing protein [Thermobifida halotolerans]